MALKTEQDFGIWKGDASSEWKKWQAQTHRAMWGPGEAAEHDQAFGRRSNRRGKLEPFCGVLKALWGCGFFSTERDLIKVLMRGITWSGLSWPWPKGELSRKGQRWGRSGGPRCEQWGGRGWRGVRAAWRNQTQSRVQCWLGGRRGCL